MKKEIAAVILLIVLFAGALINIRINDNFILSLEDEVTAAFLSAQSGDFGSAKPQLDAASEHWLSMDGYTHVFIRHTEIDSLTDAFFEFESTLSEESDGTYIGAYHRLMAHLESVRTMEHLRFGSIF